MQECGVESDVITYSSIISACEKSSQWERALELLSEMRERGIEPNVITYSAAISACEKGSKWERALELLSEMRQRGLEPNAISFNAAITACEKGAQWERALELLGEMRQRGPAPNIASFTAVMQCAVASGKIDEGFVLLQEAESAGFANDPEAYTMHQALRTACQFAGDTERVEMVTALMKRHGVSRGARAIASALIGGELSQFSNEMGDSRNDAAMLELCAEVSSNSSYEAQFDALPMLFLKRSTKQQQKKSLRHHAEKKALAEMLACGCDSLEINVNFHMCVDCHEFFKGASALLGRRIEVREPGVLHRFNEGACSCDDQWRWEARFVAEAAAAAR
jgi:pentatricopeptide repeat protein